MFMETAYDNISIEENSRELRERDRELTRSHPKMERRENGGGGGEEVFEKHYLSNGRC